MNTVAVIAARGGSKGIPKKNMIDFCNHPLLRWTVQYAIENTDRVIVSSDDDTILEYSEKLGAESSKRPVELSGDNSNSESAWIHALDDKEIKDNNIVVAFQATSPLRYRDDLSKALVQYISEGYDSLFSAREMEDMLLWKKSQNEDLKEVNFENQNRKMRQNIESKVMQENGSFYIFRAGGLRQTGIRVHKKVGLYVQSPKCSEQIDCIEELEFLKLIYRANCDVFYTPSSKDK